MPGSPPGWLLRVRRDPARHPLIPLGTALLGVAVILRVLGAAQPCPWLPAAALAWSAAYLCLLVLFASRRP